jgi:isopentenyl-diphosphate delta-isomerase
VFLIDEDKRVLMQQRASSKILFADKWANACCTHPLTSIEGEALNSDPVEGVKKASKRRLKQELGIDLDWKSLRFYGKFGYRAVANDLLLESEIDYLVFAFAS